VGYQVKGQSINRLKRLTQGVHHTTGGAKAMAEISREILDMGASGIRVISDLAAGMHGVIRLELGEPCFNTPAHISEAANQAILEGHTKYTANKGFLSLRQAIAERVSEDYALSLSPDNVVVSVGGVGTIITILRTLVNAGEEVLIPDPSWPTIEMCVTSVNAVPKRYPLKSENGFFPSAELIEKAITPKTKVLYLNSPSNPLGVVFPPELMEELIDVARRWDLFVISDEVYEKIIFGADHTCAQTFDTDGRVFSVYSFSKTYAMTGWRVGYAIAGKELIDQVGKLQEPFMSCAPSISQKAAEAALLSPQDCVKDMRKFYQENLLVAKKILDSYGFYYVAPRGAFYLWIGVDTNNSTVFARNLLDAKKVAVAPGTAFGPSGKRYIRISLASARKDIEEGLQRLSEFNGKNK
jgi:aspartate/methionine/tyrosine aminotransferase